MCRLKIVCCLLFSLSPNVVSAQLNIIGNLRTSGTECSDLTDPISFGASPSVSGGGSLTANFEVAAAWWERALPGLNSTVSIDYGWAASSGSTLAYACWSRGDFSEGWIGFDNDGTSSFFVDPTPTQAAEFTSSSVYESTYSGTLLNDGRIYSGGPASSDWDLLSIAIHEIGHTLGARGGVEPWGMDASDGDIDINIGGYSLALPATGGHLNTATTNLSPSILNGQRVLPSTADIIAIADVRAVSNFDIRPSGGELTMSGNFHDHSIWEKDVPPDPFSLVELTAPQSRTLNVNVFSSAGDLQVSGGGTLTLTGTGSFQTNNDVVIGLNANETGALHNNGISLRSEDALYVGYNGQGSFTQSSGTTRTTGDVWIATVEGSDGQITLNGGEINAVSGSLRVGDRSSGRFAHTNGVMRAQSSIIGTYASGSGEYTISGGQLEIDDDLIVG